SIVSLPSAGPASASRPRIANSAAATAVRSDGRMVTRPSAMVLFSSPVPASVMLLTVPAGDAATVSQDLSALARPGRRRVAAGRFGHALDVRRRRDRRSGAVALVGGFALRFRGRECEAAQRPRVVDLDRVAVLVFFGQLLAREEVGVGAGLADAEQV